MRQFFRIALGYTLMLGAQFAQWVCLVLMAVSVFIGVSAVFSGEWAALGVSVLAVVLWALGALVSGIAQHLGAYLLPD